MLTKHCIGCDRDLRSTEFNRRASSADGLQTRCRDCHSAQKKSWRQGERGRASVRAAGARYRATALGRETRREVIRRFHRRHPGKRSEYFKSHRDYHVEYERRRYRDDARYRLARIMRVASRRSVTSTGNRRRPTFELLGYTVAELESRLRSTLPMGFTWDDFLAGRLEIDHVVPIAAFCFTTPDHPDFARCWALSNLQLLPREDNRRKKDRAPSHFQPLLPLATTSHVATDARVDRPLRRPII